MQIVIDIKDDDYYDIIGDALIGEFTTREVINAVKDGDPVDIDKAVEHYEGTLEVLKGIDLEVDG